MGIIGAPDHLVQYPFLAYKYAQSQVRPAREIGNASCQKAQPPGLLHGPRSWRAARSVTRSKLSGRRPRTNSHRARRSIPEGPAQALGSSDEENSTDRGGDLNRHRTKNPSTKGVRRGAVPEKRFSTGEAVGPLHSGPPNTPIDRIPQ